MKIETVIRVQKYTELTSVVVAEVIVDGLSRGAVQVVKGLHADAEAYARGELDDAEMKRRWGQMRINAVAWLEAEGEYDLAAQVKELV